MSACGTAKLQPAIIDLGSVPEARRSRPIASQSQRHGRSLAGPCSYQVECSNEDPHGRYLRILGILAASPLHTRLVGATIE